MKEGVRKRGALLLAKKYLYKSSVSRLTHVRESALRKQSNPVLSPRRGCQRSLPTVKGARRWILNPREGRMAARLTCEACACVRAAGQRGSKKPRVSTTAIRLEDSVAESALFAHRWSAMRLSECIAPRTVACARLRGAAGRRKARERAFSMHHGLHCLDIVGGVCAPHVKLGIQ